MPKNKDDLYCNITQRVMYGLTANHNAIGLRDYKITTIEDLSVNWPGIKLPITDGDMNPSLSCTCVRLKT